MSAAALLADLRGRGGRLALVGDRVRVHAPPGVLSPADRETLAVRRAHVLDALTAEAAGGWTGAMRAAFAPLVHTPPAGCIAPAVCGRIGRCDRTAAGRPCHMGADR